MGRGSIRKRGRDSWQLRVYMGIDPPHPSTAMAPYHGARDATLRWAPAHRFRCRRGAGKRALEASWRYQRATSAQQVLDRSGQVDEPLGGESGHEPMKPCRHLRLIPFHLLERVARQSVHSALPFGHE